MKDEDLWNLIELARRDRRGAYNKQLEGMSNEELVDFYWDYEELKRMLMTGAYAGHLEQPVSENAHEEIADWSLCQGLEYFESLLADPSKIIPALPKGTYAPHFNEAAA